jgi:hypothetical protein
MVYIFANKYNLKFDFRFIGSGIVIESEKHWTNDGEPNSSTVTETHDQKEQLVIDNPNDPMSSVTHRLEDVHVTVESETSTPVIHGTG